MGEFFALQRFKWDHRLFWFLSSVPHQEFETFMVEGKKGQGKTRYLAGYACRMMRRGFRVASNITIRDRRYGYASVPVAGWLDVLELSVDALRNQIPTVFVIDEFHLWCDSRSWTLTPAWFRGWLAQSRHYGVGICGSVQNLKTVDLRARQIVDKLIRIRKMNLGRIPAFRFDEVAPESVDSNEAYDLTEAHFGLFKWYGGYDTRELVQVELWKSDEELEKRVEALCAEAADLVAPGIIPAFVDTFDFDGFPDPEDETRFVGAVPENA